MLLASLLPVLAAAGATTPSFYIAKLYCNDVLAAVGYIEVTGGAPQVYAYPPAAICNGRVIDTAKAMLYVLVNGAAVASNAYALRLPGLLLRVELYQASPGRMHAVVTGLELLAVALIGLMLLAVVKREELEIL